MASRELKVEIIGDSRSLERALGKAGDSATGFGSKFAKAGKVIGAAALGMAAAVGAGLFVTLKKGFEELGDSQKVMAQTEAVIKSTGGTANVTAKQVESLSEALSQKSGVDDEVIASGENMLLTFTNVRNEVGKGNDVFNQATTAVLDMSTAMGTDMQSASIQVGKALNDPIKGITALTRVGVTFTAGQKETIKSMVEAGNTMGAQKLILAELNKEFGGSAEAFGNTMPGQLAKLKNAFDEVAGEMAVKFLPILTSIVQWVNAHWPQISAVFDAVGTAIMASFNAIGVAVNWLRTQWEIHRETAIATWKAIQAAVMQAVTWIRTNLVPPIAAAIQAAMTIWHNFGGEIKAVLGVIVTLIKTSVQNMLAPFKIFFAILRGDWSAAWNEIKAVVSRTLGAMVSIIKSLGGALVSAWIQLAKMMIAGFVSGLQGLAGKLAEQMQKMWDTLKTAAATAAGFGVAIGAALIRGIADGALALVGWLKGVIENALGFLKNLNPFSTVRQGGEKFIGREIMFGAAEGVLHGAPALKTATTKATREAIEAARQAVIEAKAGLAAAFTDMASAALAAFDAVTAGFKTKSEKLLEAMRLEDAIKQVQDAVDQSKKAWDTAVVDAQKLNDEFARLVHAQSQLAAGAALDTIGLTPEEQKAMLGMTPQEAAAYIAERLAAASAASAAGNLAALDAEKAHQAALRAQVEFDLEQKAIKEREAYLAERERKRMRFEEELAALAAWGVRHHAKHGEILERVRALYKKFGVDAKALGKNIGERIAKGLMDSIPDIIAAAQAVGKAIKDNTKAGSPTKEGPLSTFDMRDAGYELMERYAKGVNAAVPLVGRAFSGMGVGGATGRGAAAGGSGIVVNVYGSVTSERDLVASLRNALVAEGRRSGGNLIGGYA